MSFQEINVREFSMKPFKMIGDQWMLITAGTREKCNTMTASWGGLGVLWGKNVATIYIRPQRYTLEFMEREEYYSLAFFDNGFREALNFCGTKSGRDFDKWKETGLTPAFDLAPYPEEARVVLICRKLYRQDMTPESFLDAEVRDKNYPGKDYHRVFVGEIVKLLIRE